MRLELLPSDRWPEIQQAFDESRSDEQLPKAGNAIILGAYERDHLVGCIGAERVWCVSPLWVSQNHRGHGLPRFLAMKLAEFNGEKLREVCITTSPHVEKLIHSMGFIPILGQTWRRDVE